MYYNFPCFSSELRDKIRNSETYFSQRQFFTSSFESCLSFKYRQIFGVLQVDIWLYENL
jgi:hypothetical protein